MDDIYNCETCDWDEENCHGCGKHTFNDGVSQGTREFYDYLKPNMDIGYADGLVTITLDKIDWEMQLKKWGVQ